MYVLPYGQMSLWGATVITNLVSAVPWIGQDIVEFLWGGLYTDEPQYGNILLKILLNAGKSPLLGFVYDLFLVILSIISVKIAMTWRQSAGVSRKFRNISTSDASQRLHAGDLTYAYIVGLFEGNGNFSIIKRGKHLIYEFSIELPIRNAKLIYKLKNLLGVGIVNIRNIEDYDIKIISLKIRNKNHLKSFILPIFDKYSMFSNKQYDYLIFKNALLSGIIYSKDLPEYVRSNKPLNIKFIVSTYYFPAWLVGFIEAKGCFSNENNISSFEISQIGSDCAGIISAIREYLSFTSNIYLDKLEQPCFKLKVTNIRSIENIIKFLNKAPVKLLGHKKLEYLLWIKQLRRISIYYKKINIPSNY